MFIFIDGFPTFSCKRVVRRQNFKTVIFPKRVSLQCFQLLGYFGLFLIFQFSLKEQWLRDLLMAMCPSFYLYSFAILNLFPGGDLRKMFRQSNFSVSNNNQQPCVTYPCNVNVANVNRRALSNEGSLPRILKSVMLTR